MKVDTHECVSACGLEFNDGECFESCDQVKKYYPGFEYREISINGKRKCRCEDLWKKTEGKIECIKGDISPKEKKYLIFGVSEYTDNSTCSDKKFNNICIKAVQ